MLEKFCVGLVRILLGGILFFLTLLSAVVTCRVYGGSEIVHSPERLIIGAWEKRSRIFMIAWIVWKAVVRRYHEKICV